MRCAGRLATGLACALVALPAAAGAAGQAGRRSAAVLPREAIAVARSDGALVLVDARGRTLRRLTGHPGWQDADPAWSPDGTRIAFTRTTDGANSIHVYVIRADGSGLRRLTSGRFDMRPAWSRDGRWIAYQAADGIRLLRVDGFGSRLLPGTRDGDAAFPHWTPDGRIAYAFHPEVPVDWPPSCRRATSRCGWVLTARPDGRDRRALVKGRDARWSPDGRLVLYTPPNGGVAVVPAAGGRSGWLGRGYLSDWAPEGRRIVFARLGEQNGDSIWVMRADGSGRHRILQGATSPAWRPTARR